MKKLKRRQFITKSAVASVSATMMMPAKGKPTTKSFVHHVFFYLNNPDSAQDKKDLIKGLEALSKVPTIRFHHIGEPGDTHRDVIKRDYALSWLAFFDNLDDEEVYQKHPVHLKFIEDCEHLWEKVVVYDADSVQ